MQRLLIKFDPSVISFKDVLRVFFTVHDPTTLNRQGNDIGTQYRSAIFYHTDEQKRDAKEVIKEITDEGVYDNPIVTEVEPLEKFWPAKNYHQEYFANNPNQPYCHAVVSPKVRKFRQKFPSAKEFELEFSKEHQHTDDDERCCDNALQPLGRYLFAQNTTDKHAEQRDNDERSMHRERSITLIRCWLSW